MAGLVRVTVTLSEKLVREIDRREKNRSKVVAEAVRNELHRRRREELRRSLNNPHPASSKVSAIGFTDWAANFPDEDAESLLDGTQGTSVRWVEGEGWSEVGG